MREIKCDHAIENPDKHPVSCYLNIGNLIIHMCMTCWNAVLGQVYSEDVGQTLQDIHKIIRAGNEGQKKKD